MQFPGGVFAASLSLVNVPARSFIVRNVCALYKIINITQNEPFTVFSKKGGLRRKNITTNH